MTGLSRLSFRGPFIEAQPDPRDLDPFAHGCARMAKYLHNFLEKRRRYVNRSKLQKASFGHRQIAVQREAVAEDSFFCHYELLVVIVELCVAGAHLDLVAAAASKQLQTFVVDLPH